MNKYVETKGTGTRLGIDINDFSVRRQTEASDDANEKVDDRALDSYWLP